MSTKRSLSFHRDIEDDDEDDEELIEHINKKLKLNNTDRRPSTPYPKTQFELGDDSSDSYKETESFSSIHDSIQEDEEVSISDEEGEVEEDDFHSAKSADSTDLEELPDSFSNDCLPKKPSILKSSTDKSNKPLQEIKKKLTIR